MTNSIGGDFNQEAFESFRKAYGERLIQPEEQDSEDAYGMRTNIIPNTSPWIAYTGLWKANDGMSRNFVPNMPLTPPAITEDTEDTDENDFEGEINASTDEEIDALILKIMGGVDASQDDGDEYEDDEDGDGDEYEDDDEDTDPEENEVLQDPDLRELSLGAHSASNNNE